VPFLPSMIFAAGYPAATTGVLHGVQTNLPIVVTFQGASRAPIGPVTVANREVAVTHEPFQLSNGNKIGTSTITADLTFDWTRYNGLSDSAKRALLLAFAAGDRLRLAIAVQGVTGSQTLPIELRILKTTDYLIDPGASVFAHPAHSPATANPNLVVPAADAITNYAYSTPGGTLGAGNLASNAHGRLTVTAAAAPGNSSNRQLRIQATAVPSVNGLGAAVTLNATGDLTANLQLPTEVVVQLDRSGSMNATNDTDTATDSTGWRRRQIVLLTDGMHDNGSTNSTILVDDGVDRVIFLAPGGGGLTVTPPAGSPSITTGISNGISWAAVDAPRQGAWTLAPAGMAVFDSALRLRCSLAPHGVGEPVTLRAKLDCQGQPVSGATIHVRVRRPAESAGEVITAFVRAGGLFSMLRNTALASVASSSVDVPGAARHGKPIAAATAAAGFDVHDNGDTQSLRRRVLEAAEEARGFELEKASGHLSLSELAPGVYEAVLLPSFTQEDGLYSFEFHAEGTTPRGAAFARDQSRDATLAPIPSPQHSQMVLEMLGVADRGVTWSATVFPRTATDRALGPGLGYMLGFAWVDEAVRKELGPVVTIDNLDGSYSATVRLPKGHKFPGLGLYTSGVRGSDSVGPVIVTDKSEDARFVTITLDRIRIIDPQDHCLRGKGELSFDVVVAPGGSPSRAVRTRVPPRGVFNLGANDCVEPGLEIYEGFVEPGSVIGVTLGGTEFDWFRYFKREEPRVRYHRMLRPEPGTHSFAPGDERHEPDSLSDWQIWYTLEVE